MHVILFINSKTEIEGIVSEIVSEISLPNIAINIRNHFIYIIIIIIIIYYYYISIQYMHWIRNICTKHSPVVSTVEELMSRDTILSST